MAIDPRKLGPGALCQLLNSTPLGEVIGTRQLFRQRTRGGFWVGDGKTVDLLKYTAWLVTERHTPEPDVDPYDAFKDRARARNAALSVAGRDIGELPAVVDPSRKQKASTDCRFFCETYFPLTFHLAWSPDHLKVIARIEQAVLRGGQFAMAMPRGSGGQLFNGERTQIGWTSKDIVLPMIPDSKAAGAIIKVGGITGGIRGMKFKRPDGRAVRPSLVILDDPQTDESARSVSQCANRESILAGAVLGLAGPGNKISSIMPCTVIRPGDMADNILDRDKHPEWNGERTRMVYSFPAEDSLWVKYAEFRSAGLRAAGDARAATAFDRDHR